MLRAVLAPFLDEAALVLVADHPMHDALLDHSARLALIRFARPRDTRRECWHILRPVKVRNANQPEECGVELGRPVAAEHGVLFLSDGMQVGHGWVVLERSDRPLEMLQRHAGGAAVAHRKCGVLELGSLVVLHRLPGQRCGVGARLLLGVLRDTRDRRRASVALGGRRRRGCGRALVGQRSISVVFRGWPLWRRARSAR
mmetsp:Transcript_39648/g.109167  ORF Transcript_39648/g.109167 Transcript_39648/m.109167 type:complete len:200 (+) Transcript_39648:399-998(+)